MPFSAESLKAKQMLEVELKCNMRLSSIYDQKQLQDYLTSKYFQMVKKNDEFEKMTHDVFVENDFRILKLGSGNYFFNLSHGEKTKTADTIEFGFDRDPCTLCLEEPID